MSVFVQVRDVSVAIGRNATVLSLEQIDEAIAEGERSLAVGPLLDPTLAIHASKPMEEQLAYLRAFRTFRAAIEEFRTEAAA